MIFNDPNELLGTYVTPGKELLSIGDPSRKEAIALIAQADGEHLAESVGEAVRMKLWGQREIVRGTVAEITPRVATDLPHFAFAGMYGGPLTVVDRTQYTDEEATPDTSQLVLLQPRYAMHIQLEPEVAAALRSGQTGVAHLRTRDGRIGRYLWQQAHAWLDSQVQETHGF